MEKDRLPFKDWARRLNGNNISAGLVAGTFGCTGSALLIINAANNLNLAKVDTISWLFSIYFFGGLIGVVLSLKYKIPISGAYTISGTVLLLGSTRIYSIEELAGAYLISGLIILFIGITGLKEKILDILPGPIVMSMVAGVLTRFILTMMESINAEPFLTILILAGFLILPKIFKKTPPIILALLVGIVGSILLKKMNISNVSFDYILPRLIFPKFNMDLIISISIPLSILIMGSENAQAIGILKSQGYNPPINVMTIASGLGSIAASMFGGHSANIAGPMTAICSSEEAGKNKDDRYLASVINGLIFIVFGVFASAALSLVTVLPKAFISLIAGLSMVGVLRKAFNETFTSSKFKTGSIFGYIIALSNITLLNIGAPLWALIIGTIVSFINEKKDFY